MSTTDGMRADWAPDPQSAGTYVNGFHETFPIVYPETAYALARTGQSILNAPDAKSMELAVGGESLLLAPDQPERSEISDFRREIDFRTGVSTSQFTWHPRRGWRVGDCGHCRRKIGPDVLKTDQRIQLGLSHQGTRLLVEGTDEKAHALTAQVAMQLNKRVEARGIDRDQLVGFENDRAGFGRQAFADRLQLRNRAEEERAV